MSYVAEGFALMWGSWVIIWGLTIPFRVAARMLGF